MTRCHRATQRRAGLTISEFLTLVAVIGLLVVLLMPAFERAGRRPMPRCNYNLKQIGLALHNYADRYGGFPPACTVDADGKPLHSWRTLILPYMDQTALYNKIDLSRAWDDPVNAEVRQTKVELFQCPDAKCPANHTTYLASVGTDSCMHPTDLRLLSDIKDGLSNTLMLVEVPADQSVPWIAPSDADEALVLKLRSTRLTHTDGMNSVLVDGSVRFLRARISIEDLKALISIAGGERLVDF